MSDTDAIVIDGLSKRFGGKYAVNDLSLTVPRGSVYGFLGRNGAGKTTTIRILMGLLSPSAGTTRVLGFDPEPGPPEMYRRVSYVPEEPHIYEWMDKKWLFGFCDGTHPDWDNALAEELWQRFTLPDGTRFGDLSRGMKGKAMLVVALASRPELLILDDPTSGLDAAVRRDFMHGIIGALDETKVTVFFSTHIISDVERIADHCAIIHDGHLLRQSRVEDLKEQVKSVQLVYEQGAPQTLTVPGALELVREDRDWTVTVDNYPVIAPALENLGADRVIVSDMTLEDIFIACTTETAAQMQRARA